jgi:hypothetical protein
VKVGDLVRCNNSIGLIVQVDEWATLVKWCDDGHVEDMDMYPDIEVVNESR